MVVVVVAGAAGRAVPWRSHGERGTTGLGAVTTRWCQGTHWLAAAAAAAASLSWQPHSPQHNSTSRPHPTRSNQYHRPKCYPGLMLYSSDICTHYHTLYSEHGAEKAEGGHDRSPKDSATPAAESMHVVGETQLAPASAAGRGRSVSTLTAIVWTTLVSLEPELRLRAGWVGPSVLHPHARGPRCLPPRRCCRCWQRRLSYRRHRRASLPSHQLHSGSSCEEIGKQCQSSSAQTPKQRTCAHG